MYSILIGLKLASVLYLLSFVCKLKKFHSDYNCVCAFIQDVLAHCARVKPILDLVNKIISTDWTISDCLLPLTSRIYMLLHR